MGSVRSVASLVIAGIVAAVSFAATPDLAAPACSVAKAHYVSMADPRWTAGFAPITKNRDWISDVAFFVRSAESRRTYWFMFDQGSARYVNLISTFDVTRPGWHPPGPDGPASERPYGEMHYLSADADLKFSLDVPFQKTSAPTYILLPDLPEWGWYRTPPMEREGAPLAFFKLQSCD
jgi:hypothetical protein